MGSMIVFSEGEDWFTSNFIYRRFLADVMANCNDDPDILRELEEAEALQVIYLHWLDPVLARKIILCMKKVADATIGDSTQLRLEWATSLDPEGQKMYLESIADIAHQLGKQLSNFGGARRDEQTQDGAASGPGTADECQ